MYREVCLFDKFSYCKNGDKCLRIHLKEVCQIRECDYRKCDKRHPRPCKIFRIRGFCKFGTSCRYSHRLPKEVEDQNKRIETLEEITKKLSKQVTDQNHEIKDLRIKLLEGDSRTIKRLQKQIDDLVESNNQKEKAIRNLENDVEQTSTSATLEEADLEKESEEEDLELEEDVDMEDDVDKKEKQVTKEEFIVSQERCKAETVKKATIKYVHKCLKQVEKLEAEIGKIKKNAEDLGTTLRTKCNEFCNRLDEIEVNEELCEDVIEKLVKGATP